MTLITRRLGRRLLAPAVAAVIAFSGVAFASSANATEGADDTATVVTDQNFDLSETAKSPTARLRGGGGNHGDVCEGDKCGPIAWCEDDRNDGPHGGKPGTKPEVAVPVPPALDSSKAIIGEEPKGGGKGEGPKGHDEPKCYNKPDVRIDSDKCCENPPGGTVYIRYHNDNKVAVPSQITVKFNGKSHTVNFWIKPGKSKVIFKEVPNGKYRIIAHLLDCVFADKVVKIECDEVTPTPTGSTPTGTPTTTPTDDTTPTATAPVPTPSKSSEAPAPGTGGGSTGGGELALTGSGSTIWWTGGGLVVLGALFLIALVLIRRRNTPQFTAE